MEILKTKQIKAGGTFIAATIPDDKPEMHVSHMTIGVPNGAAESLTVRVSQLRHKNAFNSYLDANKNETLELGNGDPKNVIYPLQSKGTLIVARDAAPAGASLGTLDVTMVLSDRK